MRKINKNKTKKDFLLIILIIILLIVLSFAIIKIMVGKNKQSLEDSYINNENIVNIENVKKESNEKKIYKKINASLPIFMYHFILDDYGDNLDVENFVKPSTLEEQLKYIVDNGYQTVFVNEIEDLSNYTKPVALTFDDCFVYFYNNAFPLLKKYNQKASIYIICNYVNGPNYLTTQQIQEMVDSGLVSVQTHTLSHRELTSLSLEEIQKELVESKKYLEETYNIQVDTVCYPIGKYNANVINIAKENYKYGLAMTGGVYYSDIHKLYEIPRIYANRSMTIQQFANYLKKSNVEIIY